IFTPILWLFDKLYSNLSQVYQRALKTALSNRAGVLVGILLISAASVLLLPRLGMELIPSMAQGELYAEITLPTGAKLENTDAVLEDLAKFTQTLPQVDRTYS